MEEAASYEFDSSKMPEYKPKPKRKPPITKDNAASLGKKGGKVSGEAKKAIKEIRNGLVELANSTNPISKKPFYEDIFNKLMRECLKGKIPAMKLFFETLGITTLKLDSDVGEKTNNQPIQIMIVSAEQQKQLKQINTDNIEIEEI